MVNNLDNVRKIGEIINQLSAGNSVLLSEFSRLVRSMQIFAEKVLGKKIILVEFEKLLTLVKEGEVIIVWIPIFKLYNYTYVK